MSLPTHGSAQRDTARLGRLGVRGKILTVGAAGLLASVALTGVGMASNERIVSAGNEIAAAGEVSVASMHIEQIISDLSRRQNGYVMESFRTGAKAVEPTGASRKAYLEDVEHVAKELDEVQPKLRTAQGTGAVKDLRADLVQWKANDELIVAAITKGPGSRQTAADLATQQGEALMEQMAGRTATLGDSSARRVAAAKDDLESAKNVATVVSISTVLVAALVLALLTLRISGAILTAVRRVLASVQAMGRGDLTVPADVGSTDEIGDMARALDESRESMRAVMRQVGDASQTVASASDELTATAGQLQASASLSAERAGAAARSAGDVSANVHTVAAGTEEMTASIREIAQSANQGAGVAADAVAVADRTNATVVQLGESSTRIGEVVKTITSIAEQTNLLALNATIEAARAGELGKGFAVVANEVKELAQETSRATEDIGRRVEQIQLDTEAAVSAIGEISTIIAQINDTQSTIASAVEEQTATTNEMGRNVHEASGGATQIAGYVAEVSQASEETSGAAEHTSRAARQLADHAHELQVLVGGFRY